MNYDPTSDVIVLPLDLSTILLVKKPMQSCYYAYIIDHFVGSISFDGVVGSSIFTSKNHAFSALQKKYKIDFQKIIHAQALIGVQRFGKNLYILIIKSSWPCARILNHHTIRTVNEIEYITISLNQHRPLTPKETSRLSHLNDFPLAGHHFWCESIDLTTPLTSALHDDNFCWNEFWARPFIKFNQRDACVFLMQGCALSKIIVLNERAFRFSLITTRESEYGGTRYVARGLNENGHAANEVQSELIVESDKGDVWSYSWRRGSAPVIWQTIVSKLGPSVSISQDYARLTPVYFSRLISLYPQEVICVNLMHNQPNHSEKPLCDAYRSAVQNIRPVRYIEFDWHGNVKNLGLSQTVQDLFREIGPPSLSFSKGSENQIIAQAPSTRKSKISQPNDSPDSETFDPSLGPSDHSGSKSYLDFQFTNEDEIGEIIPDFSRKQDTVVRINCMDSLDRTNVACFFYAAYVISFILAEADVGQVIITYDGILEMPEEVRVFLAEAFIQIGDCISFLYTNTAACMTNNFAKISGIDSNRSSDSSIALQRRYQNLLKDKNRQKGINLFVGKCLTILLPKLSCGDCPSCVSAFPAQFMPPGVIGTDGVPHDPTVLLTLSPASLEIIGVPNLVLQLSEFTRVSLIILRLLPPNQPSSLSISASITFGSKLPIAENIALPRVSSPTLIGIEIPPDYANHHNPCQRFLYLDFKLPQGQTTVVLGNIIVFGDNGLVSNEYIKRFPFSYVRLKLHSKPNCCELPSTIPSPAEFLNLSKTPSKKGRKSGRSSIKPTFKSILELEISRLTYRMSRGELFALLRQASQNPLNWRLNAHRIDNSNPPQIESNEKCSNGCGRTPSWKCHSCGKAFCESCNKVHSIKDNFYYKSRALLCEECYRDLKRLMELAGIVLNLYKEFYANYDEREKPSVTYFENHPPPVYTSPVSYPGAFFYAADNPVHNLVLTEVGGEISASFNEKTGKVQPTELALVLGCDCSLTGIQVFGKNLNLVFKMDRMIQMFELNDISQSESIEFNLGNETQSDIKEIQMKGKFFVVVIKSGTLNRLKLEGHPICIENNKKMDPKQIQNLQMSSKTEVTQIIKEKPIKAKITLIESQKVVVFKMRATTDVKTILFTNIQGVRTLLLSFYEENPDGNDKNRVPDESMYYHIPSGVDENFILTLSQPKRVDGLEIQFLDTEPMFMLSNQIVLF